MKRRLDPGLIGWERARVDAAARAERARRQRLTADRLRRLLSQSCC